MRYRIIGIWCALILLWCNGLLVDAEGLEGKITMSPDGMAFTTNAGDRNTKWYDRDYEVSTGVKSTMKQLNNGEHEYLREIREGVPIKTWKVVNSHTMCIHNTYPAGNQYHGVVFGKQVCCRPYYSGWFGYCADCGEQVNKCYFYMSDDVAGSIKSLDMSKTYYYTCPHCNNLEQGVDLGVHICKGISMNRYFVRYHANFGKGSMEKSSHMVNNATEYEGREVTPQTKLNLNTYTREGYVFAGWNTKQDGSGISFEDGATIYNLCMEENASIILYAQWKKPSSCLEIDPNGGSYGGQTGIQKIIGNYEEKYTIDDNLLVSPTGNVVHFETMGGEPLSDMVGKLVFSGWSCCQPFGGKWEENVYTFSGANGTTDRIVANYQQEAIILPEAKREGHTFRGWYADPQGMIPVGTKGQRFQPDTEMTLYASWGDLSLTSDDNYLVNQGKGAVDLNWEQEDYEDKVYEIFQKEENDLWKKLHSVEENVENFQVSKSIFYSGEEGIYTVPYSGFYTLQLTGAQGKDYGLYSGGKGGFTEATIYLRKGDKLEYIIGGQNGYNGGGEADIFGNGGGYSIVSSKEKGVIMIAAGGGGATSAEDGGPGGEIGLSEGAHAGEKGNAGGGGGYYEGKSGSVKVHIHSAECSHQHIGTPDVFGGCYTKEVSCGSKEIEFRVTHSTFFYGNVAEDGSKKLCSICNGYDCCGHLKEYGSYFCKRCGNEEKYPITQCSAKTRYEIACDTEYSCGIAEGQIEMAVASSGGANYVNGSICIDYKEVPGVQQGNGVLNILSNRVDMQEARQLKGVVATDLAAPEAIDKETIKKTAVNEQEIKVSFRKPKDNGTNYYHQVKSYNKKDMHEICESNITKNTLTSQVVGYRYLIDTNAATEVDESSFFLEDKGESPFLVVTVEEQSKYLHIAAQDKAGNIGSTIHISISDSDVVYWPLITERLLLEEGINIAPAQEKDTYYVRADGRTPIELTLKGLLCGLARKDYQIDMAEFVVRDMEDTEEKSILSIFVPKREKIVAGNYTYPTELIDKKHRGDGSVEDALFTQVQRYNLCKSLSVKQKITISKGMDAKKLRIMPRVAANGNNTITYSKEEEDIKNSIYLIGDGKGPEIKGEEQLRKLEEQDLQEDTYEILLESFDTGSGLKQFYVEIYNWDNCMTKYYEDTALNGKIRFVVEQQDPVFSGDFSIVVYAKDRVGNETSIHSGMLNVNIEAYVSRILEPHTPVFKRGESGLLHITTWGYVERLEICFPEIFTEQDKSLNQTTIYDSPGYVKKEEIPFVIPLSAIDGEMTIQVKAYKDGVVYEAQPQLITIKITGDIRDEIRTRLR